MKYLALKSFLGMINLMVIMGVCIFWPAGTFQFIPAWIYLAVFFSSVSIITIYIFIKDKRLLQSRLKVGSVAEKRIAQKIIQGFASLGFIGMYIIAGFDRRMHWSVMPDSVWMTADVILLFVMLMLFIVFRKNSFLSATIEVQQEQKVISDGPYAIVRHPMYSAALLLFVATPLALGSWYSLISFPLMVMVLIFRCTDEEKALRHELKGYDDYCRKVRFRLIPYIW